MGEGKRVDYREKTGRQRRGEINTETRGRRIDDFHGTRQPASRKGRRARAPHQPALPARFAASSAARATLFARWGVRAAQQRRAARA